MTHTWDAAAAAIEAMAMGNVPVAEPVVELRRAASKKPTLVVG
jgi:hypothetical protein